MNAIAHAAEGLYAHDGNPIIALMAEEGIRAAGARAAARWCASRATSTRAATRCTARGCAAWCSAASAMALHHKLCHTLGGSFNLPHAEVHTVVLPHALAYNAAAAPEAMARIARALGTPATRAARRCSTWRARLGAPTSLRDIGMPADGLDRAADLAVQNPYPNPRPLERAALRALLQRAFDGEPPQP